MAQQGPMLSTVPASPVGPGVSPRWKRTHRTVIAPSMDPKDASTPSSSFQSGYSEIPSHQTVPPDQVLNVSTDLSIISPASITHQHHQSTNSEARSPSSMRTSSSYRSPTKWTNFEDSEDGESGTGSHSPKLLDGPMAESASSDIETKNLLDADACSEDAQSLDEDPYVMSDDQRMYYNQCFIHLMQQTQGISDTGGALKGADDRVIDFFNKSNLARDVLSQIWNLSDVNQDGWLNLDEFCTAMHLIVLHVKGGLVVPDFLPAHIAPAVTPPRQITQDMTPETPQSAKLPAAVWQNFQDGQDARTNVDSPQLKEFSSVPPELKVEKPVAVRGSTSTDSGPPEVPQKSPSLQRAVNRNERLAPADTHTTVAKLPLSPSAPKGPPPKPPPRPNQRGHTRSASLDLTNNKTNRPVPKPAIPTSPPPMPPSGNFELREAQTQTEDRLMVQDKADVGVDRKRLSTTKLMDFEGVEELSIESKKSIDEIPSDWKSRCERLKKMNAELEHERAKLAEKRLQLELQFEQIKTKAKV